MAAKNKDYIKPGSDAHKQLLGLREATDGDEITCEGADGTVYALQDITQFGPSATRDYLHDVLRQKVRVIDAGDKPFVIQSEKPMEPGYAPPLWVPDGQPASGIV